jgi:hypothetical protein
MLSLRQDIDAEIHVIHSSEHSLISLSLFPHLSRPAVSPSYLRQTSILNVWHLLYTPLVLITGYLQCQQSLIFSM